MLTKLRLLAVAAVLCVAQIHAHEGHDDHNETTAADSDAKPANATWGISTIIRAPNGTVIGTETAYGTPVPAGTVSAATWASSTIVRDPNGTIIGTETSSGTKASDADTPRPIASSKFTPPPMPANAIAGISTPIYGPNGTMIGASVSWITRAPNATAPAATPFPSSDATPAPTPKLTAAPRPPNAIAGISTPIYAANGTIIGASVTWITQAPNATAPAATPAPASSASTTKLTAPPMPPNAIAGISTPIYDENGKTIGASVSWITKAPNATAPAPAPAAVESDTA